MASRKTLMNAFRPAKEVDDPSLFAGREQQVRSLTDALHIEGSVPLIYGHRGLGKSSLALQIARIAVGDVELLSHLNAVELSLPEEDRFLTLHVTCTDAIGNMDQLLQVLINAAESIEFVSSKGNQDVKELIDRTTRKKLTLKIVEVESTKRYEAERGRLSYQQLNLEEKLVQLTEILLDCYGQPVLFIIDELDRMGSTKGLASFLKAVSNSHLKFLLVGIANNVSELLDDHQSLERQLRPVRVPNMSVRELTQIVDQSEAYLERHAIHVSFEPAAKMRLAHLSAGFPWFVHVLGQSALVKVHDQRRDAVKADDIGQAVLDLVDNEFAQQFKDRYQNAVRDSFAREVVLRSFAQWHDPDIPTRDVYRVIKENFSFQNPSAYKGHLCKPMYGEVLYTPVFQQQGLVRFTNEMFKAYVRIRPSLFNGIDDQVNRAWMTAHL